MNLGLFILNNDKFSILFEDLKILYDLCTDLYFFYIVHIWMFSKNHVIPLFKFDKITFLYVKLKWHMSACVYVCNSDGFYFYQCHSLALSFMQFQRRRC